MDHDLIPLAPEAWRGGTCPMCGRDAVETLGTVFPGIHVLADRRCGACGKTFLEDLPVGFAVDHAFTIDRSTGRVVRRDPELEWIWGPLEQGHGAPSDAKVEVRRIVHRRCERVVLLNTLDFLYGHVLLKLYNAAHYLEHRTDLGLVVIVPRSFEWLVPEGVAEVWSVDLGLGRMQGWHRSIDTFVQGALPDFREVFLGRGFAHPEFASIDISRFTRVPAFPLERFTEAPPRMTFVLREDRIWFRSPLHKFIYRAMNRLGMKKLRTTVFSADQDRLVRRTMRSIAKRVPGIAFTVVGIGRSGGMPSNVTDLRTRKIDGAVERAWVEAYADSQLVFGVHGSNMLLPTAHAVGCIEVLPRDRLGNIVQDISVRWHDRMQVFLYRFLDEFAGPRQVCGHAVSIFTEFRTYHRHHVLNTFRPVVPTRPGASQVPG